MYKMVVIDDEYLVRLGIKETIEWNQYDIEIVGEAKNGKEGLNLIIELKPDIVISDVRMPIMDGVELLNELNKKSFDLIVIMLSGYKDFEYAKNSLENGAFSYLLKPIDNEALIKCVVDAKEQLIKKRIDNTKIANFEKEIPLIKSTLIQKLLNGNINDSSEIIKRNEEYQYGIPQKGYVVIGQIDKANNIDDKGIIKDSLKNLFELINTKLQEKQIQSCNVVFFSHFVFLINMDNDDNSYNFFKEVVNEYPLNNAVISLVISEMYNGYNDIYDKYVNCKKLFKNKMVSSLNSVSTYKDNYVNYREEISNTLRFISQNYKQNISAKQVALFLKISESHLMHLLKDELGKTFNEVLTEYRIKIAKTLLASPSYHVYEVGVMVGYNDLKYFRKIFLREVGLTPQDYRKSLQK